MNMFSMPEGIPQPTIINHIINHKNVIKPQSRTKQFKRSENSTEYKTSPYCASFDLNKQLTYFLCEAIDQQVDFLPVLNARICMCISTHGQQTDGKKSTKQPHFGAISFTKH